MQPKRAVAFLHYDEEGRILAISRKGRPDQFGLPGGKNEDDEDDLKALIREVAEETGLEVEDAMPVFSTLCFGNVSFFVTVFVGFVKDMQVLRAEEGCIVRFVDPAIIKKGPFGVYNQSLLVTVESLLTQIRPVTVIDDIFGQLFGLITWENSQSDRRRLQVAARIGSAVQAKMFDPHTVSPMTYHQACFRLFELLRIKYFFGDDYE